MERFLKEKMSKNEVITRLEEVGKVSLDTALGKLIIEKNSSDFPTGVIIKLNNAPIILIERSSNNVDEDKMVIKLYANPNVIQDNDYINYEAYGLNPKEIKTEVVSSILESLNEEEHE